MFSFRTLPQAGSTAAYPSVTSAVDSGIPDTTFSADLAGGSGGVSSNGVNNNAEAISNAEAKRYTKESNEDISRAHSTGGGNAKKAPNNNKENGSAQTNTGPKEESSSANGSTLKNRNGGKEDVFLGQKEAAATNLRSEGAKAGGVEGGKGEGNIRQAPDEDYLIHVMTKDGIPLKKNGEPCSNCAKTLKRQKA